MNSQKLTEDQRTQLVEELVADQVESDIDADAASYAIANVGDPSLRWSNADGWTDGTDYAVFSASERGVLSLPIDGAWVPAPTAALAAQQGDES